MSRLAGPPKKMFLGRRLGYSRLGYSGGWYGGLYAPESWWQLSGVQAKGTTCRPGQSCLHHPLVPRLEGEPLLACEMEKVMLFAEAYSEGTVEGHVEHWEVTGQREPAPPHIGPLHPD